MKSGPFKWAAFYCSTLWVGMLAGCVLSGLIPVKNVSGVIAAATLAFLWVSVMTLAAIGYSLDKK